MTDFSVNPNGLLDTGDELVIVTNDLTNSLENLKTHVNNFINDNKGQAVDAYILAQAQWEEGLTQMSGSLARAKVKLEEIHHEYLLADNQNAALFGGLV